MGRLDNAVKKELSKEIGRKPTKHDYIKAEVRKHMNKDGIYIYFCNKLLNVVKLKK